jgi:hypothetical protein
MDCPSQIGVVVFFSIAVERLDLVPQTHTLGHIFDKFAFIDGRPLLGERPAQHRPWSRADPGHPIQVTSLWSRYEAAALRSHEFACSLWVCEQAVNAPAARHTTKKHPSLRPTFTVRSCLQFGGLAKKRTTPEPSEQQALSAPCKYTISHNG